MANFADLVNFARARAIGRSEHENTVLRALTGGRPLLGEPVRVATVTEAAVSVATCPGYVTAAKIILTAGDERLLEEVLGGCRPLMPTAAHLRNRARLLKDYRNANRNDLQALAEMTGVSRLWDDLIAPQL